MSLTFESMTFFHFIVFTLVSFILNADCWFWEQSAGILRTKRQTNCNGEHKCSSGECINSDNLCDGTVHCEDGSDETSNLCASTKCEKYLFRCKYGACINSENECDGKQDCRDNSDETSHKCSISSRSPSLCLTGNFSCDNGECIDDINQCDGIRNCKDGSDENVMNCGTQRCEKFKFRCNYGACINSDLRCNGYPDCADNSDEYNCGYNIVSTTTTTTFRAPTTTFRPPTRISPGIPDSRGGCLLPEFPDNGKWIIFGGILMKPGEIVAENTILIVSCNTPFKLYPINGLTTCNSNQWSVTSHECFKTCSSIITTEKLIPSCSFRGSTISCETPYYETVAYLRCAPLYEDPKLKTRPQRICYEGAWNAPLPNCEPVCGLPTHKASPLLIGGENVKKGAYPWQVGLYKIAYENFIEHICGASIITTKITITAAHCFYESDDPNKYYLAAGTYYRTFNHTEDKHAQIAEIEKIIKHKRYNEPGSNEAYDFAILILVEPFKIGSYVLPVCYDARGNFDYSTLHNKTGVLIGWGFTEERSSPADTLQQLEVEFKSETECDLNENFRDLYEVPDKICAGLLHQGKSACSGDSGGGLVFRDKKDRYFIRGIVSSGPQGQKGGCNSSQLTLYTGVSFHVDMILSAMAKYP